MNIRFLAGPAMNVSLNLQRTATGGFTRLQG